MSELLFGRESESPEDAPRTIRALFEQGVWWKGADGWIRVADMHPTHRLNAAALLRRDAGGYAERVNLSELTLMGRLNAPDEVVDDWIREMEWRHKDPEWWMRSTALHRALTSTTGSQ